MKTYRSMMSMPHGKTFLCMLVVFATNVRAAIIEVMDVFVCAGKVWASAIGMVVIFSCATSGRAATTGVLAVLTCTARVRATTNGMLAVLASATRFRVATVGLLVVLACVARGRAATIGLLAVVQDETNFGFRSMQSYGSAINIAQARLVEDGVLRNETLRVVWTDRGSRIPSDGVGNVVDLVRNQHVDVIFGSADSRITLPAAHLTAHLNMPHVSWASNSYELSNKALFKTLIRTAGPMSEVGVALATVFKVMNWRKLGMIYIDINMCSYTAMGMRAEIVRNNITETQTLTYTQDTVITDAVIDSYLRALRSSSRIIFICVNELLRRFLLRACLINMCNGEFLFITTSIRPPVSGLWAVGDKQDTEARHAFRYLLFVTTAKYVGDEGRRRLEQFEHDVIKKMAEPPWYSDAARRNNITASFLAQYLYDATYFYGLWVNFSRTHDIDIRDGRAMMEFSKDLSFPGLSGPCHFRDNGDRIPYMWIYQFLDGAPQIVAIAETARDRVKETIGFRWFTDNNQPPVDTPRCGYFNEMCVTEPENGSNVAVLAVLPSVLFVVIATIGTGLVIRKRQIENAMIQSIWKVDIRELELIKSGATNCSRFSMKSTMDPDSQRDLHAVHTNGPGKMGVLQGQEVVVRNVTEAATAVLSRHDMVLLKTMRQLTHDNINPFVGAAFDIASPFVLFLYCRKGGLQDILENDDIQLDSMFKFSMTMDVIQGMQYIHSSKLAYHGRLKSSNCLVDGRWVVRITDYGLDRFLGTDKRGENERYKSLLWTAPELLVESRPRGSREGDVYSFAIIMHEIFNRQGTFAGQGHLSAKEITEMVRKREPCRPEIFADVTDVPSDVIKLMKSCWNDNPSERPNFRIIQNYFQGEMGKRNTNIVGMAMQRLEKYANNLENIIDERTKQLVTEKNKADRLLYRMLPPSCAEQLKMGEPVAPEMFDSCTVFFSDIVGFTNICSRSTPIEVVDLLNDLYCFFDGIIERHDAYKVETIGDAYLVVSGVPKRNGNLHAGVIADMSLDLNCQLENYKMKHMPEEKLVIRIGVHTGSCCAGVVGLSMPRYCLFGDTINTASRMESNGERQKIHISEATHTSLERLGGYHTVFRNEMPIKGKGMMRTYWLVGKGHLRLEED